MTLEQLRDREHATILAAARIGRIKWRNFIEFRREADSVLKPRESSIELNAPRLLNWNL